MIPSQVSIFVATSPVDMRRALDGLAEQARAGLGKDPESGALFVFRNAKRNRLKILWYDKTGYCLLYKRLDRGHFRLPEAFAEGTTAVVVDARELGAILEGVQLPRSKLTPRQIGREARIKVLQKRAAMSMHAPA
jgi:transposase